MKSVRIQSYSGPHFPPFGMSTERYFVCLRIQPEFGKMQTRIAPLQTLLYSEAHLRFWRKTVTMIRSHCQTTKFSVKDFFSADLVTFTEEIRNGKLHFFAVSAKEFLDNNSSCISTYLIHINDN